MENNQNKWPQTKTPAQATAPTPKKKTHTAWIVIGVIFLAALLTIAVFGKQQSNKEDQICCEKVCGEFNQECRGWNMDILECTFNYERYGYPWVEQVFSFKINATNKELFCNQNRTITTNNTITFGNNTANATQ